MQLLAVLAAAAAAAAVPDVRPLARRLGAPDFRDREKAGRELVALGDRALPGLAAVVPTLTDPEAARRAEAILKQLQLARLLSPRRVTLDVRNATAAEALADISRQSGLAIQPYTGPDGARINLRLRDVPFWQAADAVCGAAGIMLQPNHQDGRLMAYFSDVYSPHVAYPGPFRVSVGSVNSARTLQLANLSRTRPFVRQPEALTVNLQVQSEPRLPLHQLGQVQVLRATDDAGRNLAPPPPNPNFVTHTSYYNGGGYHQPFGISAGVTLVGADRSATEIADLRVKIPVTVLAEARPDVTITDPGTAKGKRFTGRTADVSVTAADSKNGGLSMTLTITRRGGDPNDYMWTNNLMQRIEVTDAAGTKLMINGWNNSTMGPGSATMDVKFLPPNGGGANAAAPAKFVLVEWVTLTRDVEVTLKNVPLP